MRGDHGSALSSQGRRLQVQAVGTGNEHWPGLSTFSTSRCCFMAVRESLTTHLLPQSPSGGDSRSLAGVTQREAPAAQKPCLQSQESSCNPTSRKQLEVGSSWVQPPGLVQIHSPEQLCCFLTRESSSSSSTPSPGSPPGLRQDHSPAKNSGNNQQPSPYFPCGTQCSSSEGPTDPTAFRAR